MPTIAITIEGWERIVGKYGEAAAKKAAENALKTAQEYTVGLVQKRIAGKHHVTGFLLSSISSKVMTMQTGQVYSKMGGGVYYAPFVEHGTGIYGRHGRPIRPLRAKALSWQPKTVTGRPKKGAARIARRSVKGQRPVQMFHKTLTEDAKRIGDKFNSEFMRRFRG